MRSWALIHVLLAVAAAGVWVWLAKPAEFTVTRAGAILTEQAATGQFHVVAVFVAIGVVLCFCWGVAAAMALPHTRAWHVVVFALLSLVAALIAWRLGILLGPDEVTPRSAEGLEVGATIATPLKVDSAAAFLVWPIASVAALTLVTWLSDREPQSARLQRW